MHWDNLFKTYTIFLKNSVDTEYQKFHTVFIHTGLCICFLKGSQVYASVPVWGVRVQLCFQHSFKMTAH